MTDMKRPAVCAERRWPPLSAEREAALVAKARWIWEETLRIHRAAPETRVASSLSPIEVYVCLYYGGLLRFNPREPRWPGRDRFIVSKGHGSVSMYPLLADLGFFPAEELRRVCRPGSFLGGIPDPVIPGYETINGSLGHGPGVGAGMAVGLQRKGSDARVVVMVGDGELHEGAVWEAIMFAGHHRLANLLLIVDSNTRCMLDYSEKVLDIFPLEPKFRAFGWKTWTVDGHDIRATYDGLRKALQSRDSRPRAVVARTVKGRGAPSLEHDPICHVKTLSAAEIDRLIGEGHG